MQGPNRSSSPSTSSPQSAPPTDNDVRSAPSTDPAKGEALAAAASSSDDSHSSNGASNSSGSNGSDDTADKKPPRDEGGPDAEPSKDPPDDPWPSNEELWGTYHNRLATFFVNKAARNMTSDLIQETFYRFIKQRSEGRIVARDGKIYRNAGALLFGIANNVVREYWVKNSKAKTMAEVDESSIANLNPGIATLASQAEKNNILYQCLHELKFSLQVIVEYAYLLDMQYAEIALLMRLPLGTVATRCREGRLALGRRLRRHFRAGVPLHILDDVAQRRYELENYPWYEPESGRLDHEQLLLSVAERKRRPQCRCGTVVLPGWFLEFELPPHLPGATPRELFKLSLGVWATWDEVGQPNLHCRCPTASVPP